MGLLLMFFLGGGFMVEEGSGFMFGIESDVMGLGKGRGRIGIEVLVGDCCGLKALSRGCSVGVCCSMRS